MSWVKQESVRIVRGKRYQSIVNLETGVFIFLDIFKNQPEENLNVSVWGKYPGSTEELKLFEGTEVECMNVLDKYALILDAEDIKPWD